MPPSIVRAVIASLSLAVTASLISGCAGVSRSPVAAAPAASGATIAQVYLWRARPGKFAEYSRYVRDRAEPIDREAQRAGAFLEVTTFAVNDTTVPWTHMRVFLLRDSTQLQGLSAALAAAGARLEPDSVRRRQMGEYSASLRDRVGSTVTQLLR